MKKTLIRISSLLGVLALSLLALTLSGVSAPTRAAADTDATVVEVHAIDQAYAPNVLNAPANTGFTIHLYNDDTFDNEHDIRVMDASKSTIAKTPNTCLGPCELFLQVPALAPGTYTFFCITHDDMSGTLNVS
jgi:plastocyanin